MNFMKFKIGYFIAGTMYRELKCPSWIRWCREIIIPKITMRQVKDFMEDNPINHSAPRVYAKIGKCPISSYGI